MRPLNADVALNFSSQHSRGKTSKARVNFASSSLCGARLYFNDTLQNTQVTKFYRMPCSLEYWAVSNELSTLWSSSSLHSHYTIRNTPVAWKNNILFPDGGRRRTEAVFTYILDDFEPQVSQHAFSSPTRILQFSRCKCRWPFSDICARTKFSNIHLHSKQCFSQFGSSNRKIRVTQLHSPLSLFSSHTYSYRRRLYQYAHAFPSLEQHSTTTRSFKKKKIATKERGCNNRFSQ